MGLWWVHFNCVKNSSGPNIRLSRQIAKVQVKIWIFSIAWLLLISFLGRINSGSFELDSICMFSSSQFGLIWKKDPFNWQLSVWQNCCTWDVNQCSQGPGFQKKMVPGMQFIVIIDCKLLFFWLCWCLLFVCCFGIFIFILIKLLDCREAAGAGRAALTLLVSQRRRLQIRDRFLINVFVNKQTNSRGGVGCRWETGWDAFKKIKQANTQTVVEEEAADGINVSEEETGSWCIYKQTNNRGGGD